MKKFYLFILFFSLFVQKSEAQCAESLTISSSNFLCTGNSLTLTADLGGSYDPNAVIYTWSPGGQNTASITVSPNTTTIYSCTVSINTCPDLTNSKEIFVTALPTANAGNDQIICAGSTVNLFGAYGGAANSISWTAPSGTFSNTTSTTSTYTPTLTSGTVTLILTTNDPGGPLIGCSAVSDSITITINPLPTVNAGIDQTICSNGAITLAGVRGGGSSSASWSGGNGTFTPNSTTLNAVYTPSAAEIFSGTLTLTLTTDDPTGPCVALSDQMVITINPAATVNAGEDQTICSNGLITFAGVRGGGSSSATWSGGNGIFTPNSTTLNAVYTPSSTEISAGSVIMTLTTDNPSGPCNATNDQMVITINPAATVNAGIDQTICSNSTTILVGSIGGGASSATWSGGTGTFNPIASNLDPIYTPSATEISAGSVILSLTTNDPSGPCTAVSDQVSISINATPISNAGNNQVACIGSQISLNGEIGGEATAATWVGGNGTFTPNNTDLNASYLPSSDEIEAGFVVLTLTTNDPDGPCAAAENEITITISPNVGNTTGPVTDLCQNSSWNLYENNCEDCYISWESFGGIIQGYTSSNGVYVQWDNAVSNPYLVLTITNPSTGCVANDTLFPTFSTNMAPLAHEVLLIDASFNLLGLNQTNYNLYKWGYSLKNQYTAYDIVSTGNPYASYPFIDTVNYDYWVEYGELNQCLTRSYYNQPGFLGIETSSENSVFIYPNPFSEHIKIDNITEEINVRIFNSVGALVVNTTISPSNNLIQTSHLQDGMYFVNVKQKDKSAFIFKLLKK